MGPFTFDSSDDAPTVLARLRAEGRRWRPDDVLPEVRAAGRGLAVRIDDHRFRLWVDMPGRTSRPVADGEVVAGERGARVTGRLRHSRPMVIWLAVWGSLVLGMAARALADGGGVGFALWMLFIFAAGLALSLNYRRAVQERALLAVLARCAAPRTSAAAPPPNVALQLTGYAGPAAAHPPGSSQASLRSPAQPRN